jgi:hypothetical protein
VGWRSRRRPLARPQHATSQPGQRPRRAGRQRRQSCARTRRVSANTTSAVQHSKRTADQRVRHSSRAACSPQRPRLAGCATCPQAAQRRCNPLVQLPTPAAPGQMQDSRSVQDSVGARNATAPKNRVAAFIRQATTYLKRGAEAVLGVCVLKELLPLSPVGCLPRCSGLRWRRCKPLSAANSSTQRVAEAARFAQRRACDGVRCGGDSHR